MDLGQLFALLKHDAMAISSYRLNASSYASATESSCSALDMSRNNYPYSPPAGYSGNNGSSPPPSGYPPYGQGSGRPYYPATSAVTGPQNILALPRILPPNTLITEARGAISPTHPAPAHIRILLLALLAPQCLILDPTNNHQTLFKPPKTPTPPAALPVHSLPWPVEAVTVLMLRRPTRTLFPRLLPGSRMRVCGKDFSRAHDRKRHHETQHAATPVTHKCRHCDKDFSRADSLKRHLQNGCDEAPQ
ncbi:hypothetical protein C8R46DRAFT_1222212 [Mycena filopes]|nr:hypothetical protein C8R46DRAFT_1222212 [Mycena filopes]